MSDEDCNRALLRCFYEELWIKGNVEMIPELLAEDFVDYHALSGTPPGREGLAATWRTAFLEMCDPRALHREWHAQWRIHGRAPTGRRVTMSGIHILRVAGGKITEFWCPEHLLELMHQRGAVPDFAADYAAQDER